MLVTSRHFHPSLILALKASRLHLEGDLKIFFNRVCSTLARKGVRLIQRQTLQLITYRVENTPKKVFKRLVGTNKKMECSRVFILTQLETGFEAKTQQLII